LRISKVKERKIEKEITKGLEIEGSEKVGIVLRPGIQNGRAIKIDHTY
jgi:hypothetical protein